MTLALLTVIAPLPLARLVDAQARIDALGNPARDDVRASLDRLDGRDGTHFCSLHAVRSKDAGKAYLAFEISADGTAEEAIARIARAIGPALATVFSLASDWTPTTEMGDYLLAHRVSIGVGLFDAPGLAFAGTPGMPVGRIRDEQRLAAVSAAALASLDPTTSALQRVETIRDTVARDPALVDMLEAGSPPPPFAPEDTGSLITGMAISFIVTYLWPLLIVVVACGVAGGLLHASGAPSGWAAAGGFVRGAATWLLTPGLIALGVALAVLLLVYLELRSLEERDSVEERQPTPETLAAMSARENQGAQNHMISITQRKPGGVRWFTARLVFWVIGELAARQFRPGFLGGIGSIHFARWVTVPGTRDLLFFSNYDGSWESYLEDFITRAHAGLTGVWSNSIGFPRAVNLVQRGATDGERFKRYARQSMEPTRFWYSAYPDLTTAQIRTNAQIRLGLSGALTEDEAISWLALFGSAPRPASTLVNREIQSIVFGGLGKDKPHGTCLLYTLPDSVAEARAWLGAVLPHVAFGDGRWLGHRATITLSLGFRGLRKLGLPDDGLQGFPYAFQTGMTDAVRRRILGDTGDNAPELWRWGGTAADAALLVYGSTDTEVADLEATLRRVAAEHGASLLHRIPLKPVEPNQLEPFGFADGISQPVIRGTYKGLKAADPIHLVEPGEFILGYPDNRGNLPPGPRLPALADPRNLLPLVQATGDFTRNVVDSARDVGRNGSFLVIRELEQDVAGFDRYCRAEAHRLQGLLPEPYDVTAEFIGAKLMGRWQNGSSLARNPYRAKETQPGANAPPALPATPNADPAQATARPIGPAAPTAHPIPRPGKASHVQDNDFLFGAEDPEALRCPFGAHIRRANPRDSLDPGSKEEIDISNRHRIIRIGRQYQPADGNKPGLLFMCLNADLERQFEFIQQTWLRSPSFHGLTGERDPLLGEGDEGTCGFTVPTRYGPIRLSPVPAMVATRGGGYFFLPGRRLLEFLAAPP